MVTAYRVERAKTGRAGCKNMACKAAGAQIEKGELRFGTLVEIMEHSSWMWKHWGCVTPAQIANWQKLTEGDLEMIDGLDELPEDMREKVIRAHEQGHVDDEDWRGDPELNRPGQKGIRKRTPKKKQVAEEDASAAEEPESPIKGNKRSRGKGTAVEDTEAPAPKKARGRAKKENIKEESVEEAEAPPPKKARSRPKKEIIKAENSDEEEAPPPKKSRAKVKKQTIKKEANDDEVEAPPPKKSRARAGKVANADETVDSAAKAPKKSTRAKKSVPQVKEELSDPLSDVPSDDGAVKEEPKAKASRKKKDAAAAGNAANGDVQKPKRGRKKVDV